MVATSGSAVLERCLNAFLFSGRYCGASSSFCVRAASDGRQQPLLAEGKTLPLPCVFTAFVAKAVPLPCGLPAGSASSGGSGPGGRPEIEGALLELRTGQRRVSDLASRQGCVLHVAVMRSVRRRLFALLVSYPCMCLSWGAQGRGILEDTRKLSEGFAFGLLLILCVRCRAAAVHPLLHHLLVAEGDHRHRR